MKYYVKKVVPCKLDCVVRTTLVVEGKKLHEEHITMYTPRSDQPEPYCEDFSWTNSGLKKYL